MKINKFIYISLILFLLQIFVFKQFAIGVSGFVFLYVGVLLLLPLDLDALLTLITAFFVGLFIDFFYDTIGLNAASCVAMMYARRQLLKFYVPRTGLEQGSNATIRDMGFQWVFTYTIILVFIHHSFLFSLEQFSFDNFVDLIIKIVLSTLLTTSVFFIFQIAFFTSKSRK